jgi:hypothetical protein
MKVIVEKDGRTFECYANAIGCAMCAVNIYEVVRPNWKIFRTKYRESYSFFVDDFDTIKKGIEHCVARLFKREQIEEERAKKWAEGT